MDRGLSDARLKFLLDYGTQALAGAPTRDGEVRRRCAFVKGVAGNPTAGRLVGTDPHIPI
jgi:hypothetical protein